MFARVKFLYLIFISAFFSFLFYSRIFYEYVSNNRSIFLIREYDLKFAEGAFRLEWKYLGHVERSIELH